MALKIKKKRRDNMISFRAAHTHTAFSHSCTAIAGNLFTMFSKDANIGTCPATLTHKHSVKYYTCGTHVIVNQVQAYRRNNERSANRLNFKFVKMKKDISRGTEKEISARALVYV